jgi:uncharacterized coiled-coil protein SlyX
MNTHTKLVFGAALLVPVLIFTTATAVVEENASPGRNPNNSDEVRFTQAEGAEEEQSSEEQTSTREERLEARKEKYQLRLTFAQEQRLKSRCKASQGKIRSLEGRIKGIETSRSQVYGNLLERLTVLSSRLDEQGYNVSTLNEQLIDLQINIDTFNVQLENYKTAVSDLAEMDCESNPEAFKASLEEARESLNELKTSSNDIRTYMKGTLKTILQQIRSELMGDEDQPEESDEDQTQESDEPQDTTEEEVN